jgi:hypothetical protein
VGLVIVRDLLDRSIKSAVMAKKMGLPLLAVIPTIRSEDQKQALRRRDFALHLVVSLYLAAFLALVMVEATGLPHVNDFMQKTKTGFSGFFKNEPVPFGGERP